MSETNPEFIYKTETHYDQLDGQMLLHHPRYMVFVERAQQIWFEKLLGAPRFDWRNFPDMYIVVRKMEIEYLLPIDGVKDIQVHLWPEAVRAATLKVKFSFKSEDGSITYAKGYRLNCKVDQKTHQPLLWTDPFRERLETILAQ